MTDKAQLSKLSLFLSHTDTNTHTHTHKHERDQDQIKGTFASKLFVKAFLKISWSTLPLFTFQLWTLKQQHSDKKLVGADWGAAIHYCFSTEHETLNKNLLLLSPSDFVDQLECFLHYYIYSRHCWQSSIIWLSANKTVLLKWALKCFYFESITDHLNRQYK